MVKRVHTEDMKWFVAIIKNIAVMLPESEDNKHMFYPEMGQEIIQQGLTIREAYYFQYGYNYNADFDAVDIAE
jgi:hypothetical protein